MTLFLVLFGFILSFQEGEPFKLILHTGHDFSHPFITYTENEQISTNEKHENLFISASIDENDSFQKLPMFNVFPEDCKPASSCYEFKGYAFDYENYPKWTDFSKNYLTPELHYMPVSNKTLLYFSANDKSTGNYAAGFAELGAENWTETSAAIISKSGKNIEGASILKDYTTAGDVKQWKIYMYYSDGTHIYGVRLNNEGTELYPNTCPELLLEGDQFGRPTVLKKNRYFYILDATSTKAKVFRSPTALGSFSEKEELKVLCPIQYTWNNCSVSEKERVYRIACETNYLWAFSNSFDMPRRPGIAVLGWLNTGWPYIHNTKDAGDSCS